MPLRGVPALDLSKLAHERARKPPTPRIAPSTEAAKSYESASESSFMPENPLQLLRDYQNVLAKHVTQRPGLASASPRYESPSCTERTTEHTLRLSHRSSSSVSHARDGWSGPSSHARDA